MDDARYGFVGRGEDAMRNGAALAAVASPFLLMQELAGVWPRPSPIIQVGSPQTCHILSHPVHTLASSPPANAWPVANWKAAAVYVQTPHDDIGWEAPDPTAPGAWPLNCKIQNQRAKLRRESQPASRAGVDVVGA